jgi:uncharacterized protein (TIGR02246 family)
MRRTSVFVAIAFLAGLGIGLLGRGAFTSMLQRRAHTADLAGIEKLHRADVEATLTQDPRFLNALWSDDAVKLDVPGPPVVGKKALQELYEKARTAYPDLKVLKYAPEYKDVQVSDGWAIEVIYGESTYTLSAKDNPVTVHGEALRVMKRQKDGSWNFALVGLK